MSRFPTIDPFRIPFQPSDGLTRLENPYDEPGTWHNDKRHDLITGCFPAITAITDVELTGADPSTGTWSITVTPRSTRYGDASADGMQAATISFVAAATTLANTVLGLITAADTAALIVNPDDLDSWERFKSYVTLSVSPSGATFLRITAKQSGMTFDVEVVTPLGVGGDTVNSSTTTAIQAPGSTTLAVGCYAAIDRNLGGNGYNDQGQPYLALVTSATAAADLVGPVWIGTNTEPLSPGDKYRVYDEASDVPLVDYGDVRAAGTKAIPAASIGTPVYVLHTATGDFPPGAVTDAAGAAAGATANVWTMTPVVANSTLYTLSITFGDEVVPLSYTSDGTAADTEITAGLLAQLNLYNQAGGPLEGITGVDGATLVLTGPATGESFTPASTDVGDAGEAETTPGVTTHIKHPSDTFLARSPGVGSAPITVPHP